MNSNELTELLSNDIKNFVGDWVSNHYEELIACEEDTPEQSVIPGGLSAALGFMLATIALNSGWTKKQLMEFVEIAKKMVSLQAEKSFDTQAGTK